MSAQEDLFLSGYDGVEMDPSDLKASFTKLKIIHGQRLSELEGLRREYSNINAQLEMRLKSTEDLLNAERFYKDYYLSELLKMR